MIKKSKFLNHSFLNKHLLILKKYRKMNSAAYDYDSYSSSILKQKKKWNKKTIS